MFGKKSSDIMSRETEEEIEFQEPKEEVEETPPLTWKEMKALKRSRYNEKFQKYKTEYVIQNRRTKQIAEIRAVSSTHACNLIGWRPRHVTILEKRDLEEQDNKFETAESGSVKRDGK